jgi:steroid delta-isomerase-like uncharacterized protein
MTHDEILILLARRREAFNARDMTAVGALYAETARLDSPLAGSVQGREAIVRATEAFFVAFPDAVIVEEAPIVDAARAVVVAEVTGTHVGAILGLPPSGRPFRFLLAFVLDLGDQAIVHERRIYDFTGLLVQIGVLKAKPA